MVRVSIRVPRLCAHNLVLLVTAVERAYWKAGYDIRVDMQTKDKPITLIYKAEITQDTGEVCYSSSIALILSQ